MTAAISPTPAMPGAISGRKSISLPGDVVERIYSRGGKSHVVVRDLDRYRRLLIWQMSDLRSQLTTGLVDQLISIASARQYTPVHHRTTDCHGRVRRVESATNADVIGDIRCQMLTDAISNDRGSDAPGLLQQSVCNLGEGHIVALVDHAERLGASSDKEGNHGDIHTGSGC